MGERFTNEAKIHAIESLLWYPIDESQTRENNTNERNLIRAELDAYEKNIADMENIGIYIFVNEFQRLNTGILHLIQFLNVWCKKNKQDFPTVFRVAQKLLSFAPSSAESERNFSIVGTIHAKARKSTGWKVDLPTK